MDLYLSLAQNYRIGVYIHEPEKWADMGSLNGLKRAQELLPLLDTISST